MTEFRLTALTEIVVEMENGSRPAGGVNGSSVGVFSLGAEHLNEVGGFDLTNKKFVPVEFYGAMKRGIVKVHDILIVKDGATTGKVAFVEDVFPYRPCCINEHLFRIAVNNDIADPRYIFYYLLGPNGNRQILSDFHGATVGGISQQFLDKVFVPLPPLPEQQRIAGILARADHLRRLRRYALELSEGYLQAVFVEMFGDPVRNPKGWQEGQLARLCATTIDCPHATPIYSANPTPYPCIRSSDIQNGYLDWNTTKYVSESEYRSRVKRLVPAHGDVVYCREGARFGNAAIIPKDTKLCLGQRMMLFRAAPGVATAEFVWATLESEAIYLQAERLAGGSGSPHVNVQDIKAFTVMIPPIELQRQFAHVVQKHTRLRAQQREAARQAEQLFGALLDRAFRGEL